MRKRGQDSEAVMARRLAAAREEMSHYDEFDYVIVNEHFDTAVDEMCTIFAASRLRRRVPAQRNPARIETLLAWESALLALRGATPAASIWARVIKQHSTDHMRVGKQRCQAGSAS